MALWQQRVQDVRMFLLPAARPTTEGPSACSAPSPRMPAYQFSLTRHNAYTWPGARTHCHALVRMRWLAIYYFRHCCGGKIQASKKILRGRGLNGQAEILTTILPRNLHFASCVQHFRVQKDASEHCSEYCLFFCPAGKNLPLSQLETVMPASPCETSQI